jgi:hypothetical protein
MVWESAPRRLDVDSTPDAAEAVSTHARDH